MKAILAIVLLGLLSTSLAFYTVKKLPSTVIDTSFLKNANTPKKHTFAGLTALMQQLRDVSVVQDFLDGLLQQLADTRQQKLAIIEQTRANCAEEADFRQEAILEGQRGGDAAQAQINLCSAQQSQAQSLRDLASSALAVYQDSLEALNAARAQQRANYETNVAKLAHARDAIAQLQALLDEFEAEANSPLSSESFLQLTNKLLRHTISTGHSHLVLPVYTKLLQMHAKQAVNPDDLAEIRGLLNRLDQNAAQTDDDLDNAEAEDAQDYATESSRLQGLIDRLSNQVAVTEAFIITMDQCLAQENAVLALSNDKVTRNTDLLQVAGQLCEAGEEEWRLSELNRSREVSIIEILKSAINRLESDWEAEKGPQVEDIIQVRML